jgi:hypothetical protein
VSELDMNQEYLVLVVENAKGEATGLRVREDPNLGMVLRLFSNKAKLDTYLERSDENQRFMDLLEQRQSSSEDLNLGYRRMTLLELAPILKDYGVDNLQIDPLTPGGWNRIYTPPHKE